MGAWDLGLLLPETYSFYFFESVPQDPKPGALDVGEYLFRSELLMSFFLTQHFTLDLLLCFFQ